MWKLRSQGWTMGSIAKELGISEATVSRALLKIDTRANEKLAETRMQQKLAQISQLLWQYEEHCKAWEKSKEPRRRAILREGKDGSAEQTEAPDQCGETRYLAEARSCLRDIRSLLGLDIMASQQDSDMVLINLLAKLNLPYVGYKSEAQAGQSGNPPEPSGATSEGTGGVPKEPESIQ